MTPMSITSLIHLLNLRNVKVSDIPHMLTLVGIRNSQVRLNTFNDLFVLICPTRSNGYEVRQYLATTFPGTPNLIKPVNPKGTAVLVPGVYKDCYALGLHKGRYEALVQVRPVKVWRDNDKDEVPEKTQYIDEGLFGINIHRASSTSLLIGQDSAGCQVIKRRADYDEFIDYCNKHKADHGNKFTYNLIEV